MPRSLLLSLLATLLIAYDGLAQSITLTNQQLASVSAQLGNAAQKRYALILWFGTQDLQLPSSWEIGTRAQVLTEYIAPEFGLMSTNCSFPLPTTAPNLDTLLQIAQSVVAQKPKNVLPLFNDGSAADPASAGPVVLIANWTGLRDQDYAGVAEQQLDYLLNHAPRHPNGAISHRNDTIQLWYVKYTVHRRVAHFRPFFRSDFIYMVPPFLAMYGAIQKNTTVMDEAYNQIKLYRDVLRDSSGLWRHIAGEGDGLDQGTYKQYVLKCLNLTYSCPLEAIGPLETVGPLWGCCGLPAPTGRMAPDMMTGKATSFIGPPRSSMQCTPISL